MNPDSVDLRAWLLAEEARFLVVGAHALAVHWVPRATGDIDVSIERSPENAPRVWRALQAFGAPAGARGVRPADLEMPDVVVQIGLPPRRIDVLTGVTGLELEEAWTGRVVHRVAGLDVPFLGREALVRNERASGRFKDLGDLEALGEAPPPGGGRRLAPVSVSGPADLVGRPGRRHGCSIPARRARSARSGARRGRPPNHARTGFSSAIRCGWSASAPVRFFRSSTSDWQFPSERRAPRVVGARPAHEPACRLQTRTGCVVGRRPSRRPVSGTD